MNTNKTALGFIAGAAIGAFAAILLAPDSGEITRAKLFGKTGDVDSALDDAADAVIDGADKAASTVKKGADAIKDKVDKNVKIWKDNAKSELS